jgi:hypothetical protein
MIKKIKKYIPEVLILLGVWIYAYSHFLVFFKRNEKEGKFLAIILLSMGIAVFIRRYLEKENKK